MNKKSTCTLSIVLLRVFHYFLQVQKLFEWKLSSFFHLFFYWKTFFYTFLCCSCAFYAIIVRKNHGRKKNETYIEFSYYWKTYQSNFSHFSIVFHFLWIPLTWTRKIPAPGSYQYHIFVSFAIFEMSRDKTETIFSIFFK